MKQPEIQSFSDSGLVSLQHRELVSLDRNEIVYCVDGRRPSACTRGNHKPASFFLVPPVLAASQVWDCTRHHVLETLNRATLARSMPLLVRLSDVSADLKAVQSAWERHVQACSGATFRVVTPVTEGAHMSLAEARRVDGTSIQHDLDEMPCSHNPIIDFLRQHAELKLGSMWLRVERWIEHSIGRIARRPAFITGTHSTTTPTHFDEYDSVAFVLKGAKTFYVAPPKQVKQTGSKMMHESTAHPYKPGTSREQASPQPFERIEVPAGGMLFLPARWWHFVESTPNTLMVCAWVESEQ